VLERTVNGQEAVVGDAVFLNGSLEECTTQRAFLGDLDSFVDFFVFIKFNTCDSWRVTGLKISFAVFLATIAIKAM